MPAGDAVILRVQAALGRWRGGLEHLAADQSFPALVGLTFATIVTFLYAPALGSSFQGDDFHWLHYILFKNSALFEGVGWETYLTPFFEPGVWILFRPGFQFLFLLDFAAWGTNPFGYHLTSLLLHVAASFLVFLLYWELTRQRLAAAVAGLLFAVMPVHVEAVSWFAARADSLCTVWFLLSVVFFANYRRRGRLQSYLFSLLAFAMALMAKENGATLPALIALYDLLYTDLRKVNWRSLIAANLPFELLLLGYMILRIALLAQLVGYTQSHLFQPAWIGLVTTYLASLFDPFVTDITTASAALVLVLVAIGMLFLRANRQFLYGVSWLGITVIPSFLSLDAAFFDRFAYLPSVGLAIVLGSVLARPASSAFRWRVIATLFLALLLLSYGISLQRKNEEVARSAQITRILPEQLRLLYPSFPDGARLVFTGIPTVAVPRGVQALVWVLPQALHIAYNDSSLKAYSYDKFPLWLDDLDRTYFFEYKRRSVIERPDLIQALERRKACAGVSQPGIIWDFSENNQGWEPWNQLAPLEIHDAILTTQSHGDDPYLVSPSIDVSTMRIGDIEITMRVRSTKDTFDGQVYWLATGQQDFSPALRETFEGKADGEFHTYRVDISRRGMLLMGDSVTRLRLDPLQAPGEIELKSIRVNVHCATTRDDQCQCSEGENR